MDYENKILDEIENYKGIEKVHDLPNSFQYIADKYLSQLLLQKIGVKSFPDLILQHIQLLNSKSKNSIDILSLGSGNCDFEINFANIHDLQVNFTCVEINPYMLERAKTNLSVRKCKTKFNFICTDINKIKIDKPFDIIIANHSLHHFVELEHIFSEVSNCMSSDSFFIINDMIGRNGHMFWDDTFDLCNRVWRILPDEYKYNHQQLNQFFYKRVQFDCSVEGFEGIRAQDILPNLDTKFRFKQFGTFFSLINRFIDRDFGSNFDVENNFDRSFLDFIWYLDDYCLRNKILRPTQVIASMTLPNVSSYATQYTYFEKPEDIYNMAEKGVIDRLFSRKKIDKDELYINHQMLDDFIVYGFYFTEDDFKFTNGSGRIVIDGVKPAYRYKVYLRYFIPDVFRIDEWPEILLNGEIRSDEFRKSDDPRYQLVFDFNLEEEIIINEVAINSSSVCPKDLLIGSNDVRKLGIAFQAIRIETVNENS